MHNVMLADVKQGKLRMYIHSISDRDFKNIQKPGFRPLDKKWCLNNFFFFVKIFHGLFYKRNKHFIKTLLKLFVIANKI